MPKFTFTSNRNGLAGSLNFLSCSPHEDLIREPFKKNPGISDLFQKGGGSRPIRNPYFDLACEDSMLTGSPNLENGLEHLSVLKIPK